MSFKKFAIGLFNPVAILCFLLGANSLLGFETLFSFNVGAEVVSIPLPSFGKVAGVILLVFPFIEPLRVWGGKFVLRLAGVGVTALGKGEIEGSEEEDKKGLKGLFKRVQGFIANKATESKSEGL